MSRQCDAFDCPADISTGRFLCLKHWRMVPTDTQRTINARYRAGRKDFAFLSDAVYLQACVDAINCIAAAEHGADHYAGEGSYHRLLRVALRKAAS